MLVLCLAGTLPRRKSRVASLAEMGLSGRSEVQTFAHPRCCCASAWHTRAIKAAPTVPAPAAALRSAPCQLKPRVLPRCCRSAATRGAHAAAEPIKDSAGARLHRL